MPDQSKVAAIHALFVTKDPIRVGHREVSVWPETLERWVKEGYPTEEVAGEDGKIACQPVDWITHLDLDMTWAGREKRLDLLPIAGLQREIDENSEWVLYENGGGAIRRVWKNRMGAPENIDFRMNSRKVWDEKYRSNLLPFDPSRIDFDGIRHDLARRRAQGLWTFYQLGLLWGIARDTMGDVNLLQSLIDDPAWVHDFNRVYTDAIKETLRLLFERVGLPEGVRFTEDLAYRNGPFCSPRMLDTFYLPYFREVVDFVHSYGLVANLHTCGSVTKALPMIVEAGFDVLDPLEVKAGCDVFRFAELYGEQLAFVGGFDVRILESGDRDWIKREVIQLVEGMKARDARYVFSTDHSVSPLVGYQDYLYAREIYREHMWY